MRTQQGNINQTYWIRTIDENLPVGNSNQGA